MYTVAVRLPGLTLRCNCLTSASPWQGRAAHGSLEWRELLHGRQILRRALPDQLRQLLPTCRQLDASGFRVLVPGSRVRCDCLTSARWGGAHDSLEWCEVLTAGPDPSPCASQSAPAAFLPHPCFPTLEPRVKAAINQCADCLTPVKQTRCLCVPVVAVRLACPTDTTSHGWHA